MGKNRTIQSLGKVIGNVAVHKITLKYGDKLDSRNHTSSEIIAYRENAIGIAQEFNWNDFDKIRIKQEALKEFTGKMKRKYGEIKFSMPEAEEIIGETIKECLEG